MDTHLSGGSGSTKEMLHTNNALIVFTRNPILGEVKTRIAKSCGDKKALNIYKKLLSNNSNLLENLINIKTLIYYDKVIENKIYRDKYEKKIQVEGSLGYKMYCAFLDCKNVRQGFPVSLHCLDVCDIVCHFTLETIVNEFRTPFSNTICECAYHRNS